MAASRFRDTPLVSIRNSAGTELKLSEKWNGFVRSHIYVGFEVLTAIVLKSSIICDIRPCGPLKVKPRFGVTSQG
jgi:hypothetical protein